MAKETSNWFANGTQVMITTKGGNTINGTIKGGDYNICTWDREYDVEYFNTEHGRMFLMLGVPERAISIRNN